MGVVRDGGRKKGQGQSETGRQSFQRAEKEAISYLNTWNSNAESRLVQLQRSGWKIFAGQFRVTVKLYYNSDYICIGMITTVLLKTLG